MGLPRHGCKHDIAKTGQPRQDSQDRTARTGQDSNVKIAIPLEGFYEVNFLK
jgi:hypothetical protein